MTLGPSDRKISIFSGRNRFGHAIAVVALLAALPFMVLACSASLGDVPFDLVAEGVSEPVSCAPADDLRFVLRCPSTPYVSEATAFEAWTVMKEVAQAAFGVEALWAGRIIGAGIGRDGKSSDSGLSGWSASWVAGEPEDPDMLVVDTTGGACMVQNRCGCVSSGTCPGFSTVNLESAVEPEQDSQAAILAAFPDDTDETRYNLEYDGTTGNWTVTRVAVSTQVDTVEPDSAADVTLDAEHDTALDTAS